LIPGGKLCGAQPNDGVAPFAGDPRKVIVPDEQNEARETWPRKSKAELSRSNPMKAIENRIGVEPDGIMTADRPLCHAESLRLLVA